MDGEEAALLERRISGIERDLQKAIDLLLGLSVENQMLTEALTLFGLSIQGPGRPVPPGVLATVVENIRSHASEEDIDLGARVLRNLNLWRTA